MKKKLALLMAAIMTVAMVPMTAFAATKLTVAKNLSVGVGDSYVFDGLVELKNDNSQVGTNEPFTFKLELENGKFAKADGVTVEKADGTTTEVDDEYIMNGKVYLEQAGTKYGNGYGDLNVPGDGNIDITKINVKSDTLAEITISSFKAGKSVVIPIKAYAVEAGEVKAHLWSNKTVEFDVSGVIATAKEGDVTIESDGVVTFVEDSRDNQKKMKPITITSLYNKAISLENKTITLKLKGNYRFVTTKLADGLTYLADDQGNKIGLPERISFLNDEVNVAWINTTLSKVSSDEIVIAFTDDISAEQVAEIYISGIYIEPKGSCDPGDVATLVISSDEFDTVKLEVAKMVEEAVTYTVEDKDLPTIWAGKDYDVADKSNTLKVSVEENTGDILNTSRKATFTFPEGIEVKALSFTDKELEPDFEYKIDENVVTIWNYSKNKVANESEKATDFGMKFLLNAAPTFSGDVTVTLGGEFDDVEFKVATVKAPYTIEAKTSEVLIDYRYVPVNEIIITEAEDGILEDENEIVLAVEKMDFEDAGSYEVTEGDIDVDVNIDELDKVNMLTITVNDESTEASTIVISGLELYLDRTLPVGGYALKNIGFIDDRQEAIKVNNILWENSEVDDYDQDAVNGTKANKATADGLFKYKDVVVNDSYVEVVTQARDQDDYTTNRKIVITIGATTMAVGTETVTLDAPAYINAENYTELPLRAVSEAFGATVAWDDASRTVTVMMGQRIVSMTIGSKTMYINGTPVAMNTAPEITADRTFVPVRDLANALGISKIDWNEAAATVTLN